MRLNSGLKILRDIARKRKQTFYAPEKRGSRKKEKAGQCPAANAIRRERESHTSTSSSISSSSSTTNAPTKCVSSTERTEENDNKYQH